MRTALLLLLALAAPALASQTQTVWKWVDDKGVTHYSDRPVPGATKIELSVGSNQTQSANDNIPSSRPGAQEPAAPSGPAYRNFEIWKPQNDESVVNTGGVVTVNVRVDPELQRGHNLHLYLDGKRVEGFSENTTSFELKEVPRGMHTLNAIIMDNRGNRLQQTAQVIFHMRQESIGKPPVGPTLRPPPKPRASNKPLTKQPAYADLNGPRPRIDPRTNLPIVQKAPPKPTPPKAP